MILIVVLLNCLSFQSNTYYNIEYRGDNFSMLAHVDETKDSIYIDLLLINELNKEILIPLDFEEFGVNPLKSFYSITYRDVSGYEFPPRGIKLNYQYIHNKGVFRIIRQFKKDETFRVDRLLIEVGYLVDSPLLKDYRKYLKRNDILNVKVSKKLRNYILTNMGGIPGCTIDIKKDEEGNWTKGVIFS